MKFYTRTVDVPQFPDRLQVRMSTNGTSVDVGTSATDVGDFTTLLLDINPGLTTSGYPNVWTQFTVTVSGVPTLTTGRLAFRYFVPNGGPNGFNSDYIGIDSFRFTSPCATPTPTATGTPTSAPEPKPPPPSPPGPILKPVAILTPILVSKNSVGVTAPGRLAGCVAPNAFGPDAISGRVAATPVIAAYAIPWRSFDFREPEMCGKGARPTYMRKPAPT